MTAVVIVGAGLAGVRVAEGLTERGFDGSVVLLSGERDEPYDRPPLSKHVLRQERDPFFLLTSTGAQEQGIDLRLGVSATGLDLAARHVLTTDGPISFDEVVIATGAEPRRLPGAPGLTLRTLEDCRALGEQLAPGSRLGIVGAGLIGCEVAASARARDVEVHLVDLLAGPLIRVLGAEVSQRLQQLHEERGVTFHLGTGVLEATSSTLSLTDGTFLKIDAVLEAMGVVPSTTWLADTVLPIRDGVLCDEVGRVAEGVWAVGDVARWSDGDGGTVRHEHWTSASEQAAVVAAAIVGQEPPALSTPYWWSDQYDLKLQGLGHTTANVQLVQTGPRQRTVAVYSENDHVTGVVGFSAGAAVMKLRDAVTRHAPVDEVLAALA